MNSAARPWRYCAVLALSAALLPACGNDQLLQLKREAGALREELDELKRSQAASRVQFDEFRNRLILIEDKADSDRVARARRPDRSDWIPQLPTVKVGARGGSESSAANDDPNAHVDARDRTDVPSVLPRMDGGQRLGVSAHTIRLGHDEPLPSRDQDPGDPDGVEVSGPADDPAPQLGSPKAKLDPAATMYEKAKLLFDQGQMSEARRLFESLHRQYPRHDLADNALYWIAEGYYAQAQWLTSAQAFLRVAKDYPRGNKVPDAMLKMAYCYRKLGDDRGGDDVLRQLVRLYPGTEPAEKAASLRKSSTDAGTP